MKILIIGNGGREHAIGWKIKQDNPQVQLFFANGNAGTAQLGTNVALSGIEACKAFALENEIDLTIVGPEADLVEGIVDVFQAEGLAIFGPHQAAAQIEGSKAFAKAFMQKHGVKTATYHTFTSADTAKEHVQTQTQFPIVIKASGLAAGKGVVICESQTHALETLDEIMTQKSFGDAGNEVVIEEFLEGFEVSVLSVFNGKEITPFISAKDHKKIGEGETGLNTGGMGVLAPSPQFTAQYEERFLQDILLPTQRGLLAEGLIFSGVIFFGLMVTKNGVYLLEYNMRFGDPETQAVLPLLESNLLEIIQKSISKETIDLQWKNHYACCVVMASGGYPLTYEKGYEIRGLDQVETPIYMAGVAQKDQKFVTSGGRVLGVVGMGNTPNHAREMAYENVKKIHFDYEYYRNDIGLDVL